MKKQIAVFVLLLLITAGSFAQNLTKSFGGGFIFDYSGNNGVKGKESGITEFVGFRNTSYGGFIFFDMSFVELGLNFSYGLLRIVDRVSDDTTKLTLSAEFGSALQLGFSVLGKYPTPLGGGAATLFPMFGVDYSRVIYAMDPDRNKISKAGDFSQFGLLAGMGLDLDFSRNIFLRTEALFHVRFPSKVIKDMSGYIYKTTLGMGPQIKVAMGGRF